MGRPSAISAGKTSRSIESDPGGSQRDSADGSSTYVPALMSPGTCSCGFSRNSITRPSACVATRPNARASSTCARAIVAAAPRVRCVATMAVTSRSVTMSPFSARNGSSVPTEVSAFTIAPPVPSGSVSVIHVIVGSPPRASMNERNVSSRYELDRMTSCTPCRDRWSSVWWRTARSISGRSSFLIVSVSGRRRVPSPPTRTTALIRSRMGRPGDQEDPQGNAGDARPAERRHLLVEHEVIEQQDRDVRERGERIRERQRRARQDDQPHERGYAEEEEPAPHERLPDEDAQRAAAERERRRSELVVHVVHPRLQRELRHRGERDGQEDHRDEHGRRSFPDVRLRCFRERVRARGAHRTSTSTSTRASTRSCTRGTSTTSNTYRCVCTWYRWPVGRADNPTVIQYFPVSYGNASMRKRTRRFPSTRPRSIPFVDARASRTGWFVAPSRMAKSTSRSSTGSFVRTSTWIVRGSCRRTSPSPEPFARMTCTSAISASRVPCSGTNPGSVTPSNT